MMMDGMTPLYWHWLVAGMLLVVAEIFLASFTVFWFGLGACLIGLILWLGLALSLNWQILLWLLSSIAFAFGWFKVIKPLSVDRTMAGLSREAVLGERGLLIKATGKPGQRGEVRFQIPLLGSDTWPCVANAPINAGETVEIKDVMGNTLVVSPISAPPSS
ncbi:NfeD family protein [uncultured Desulfuromusa sp.]|uniref:NfeD family protein n=2 Tax=uncultured Desulfuromusa sp. TaxID=219183 RepID=UPI003748C8FE